MNEPLSLQKQLMTRIVLFISPFSLLALLFGQWRIGLGLALGMVGALMHIRLVVLDVCKLTRIQNPNVASKHARRGYAKRMLLFALILSIPYFNPWFDFASTAVGLLSIKAAVYLGEFLTYINNKQR